MTSVTLNQGLQTVGEQAFGYCESLTELVFPATLVNIESSAFNDSGIKKITFQGSSLTAVGSYTFNGSGGITGAKIIVPEGFTVGSASVTAGKTGEAPFYKNYATFSNGKATVVWEDYNGTVLRTYTATVEFGGNPYYDVKEEILPATGTPDEPDEPDIPDEPDTPDGPDTPDEPGVCPLCGMTHGDGVFGKILCVICRIIFFMKTVFTTVSALLPEVV